jgi:uncharacterized membrane protein YkoI
MRRSTVRALALVAASAIFAAVALPVVAQTKPPEKTAKEKSIVQAMEENKITLVRAIEVAEESSKGKAIGARAALDRDKLSFTVQCVVDDKLEVVRIDGKTGKTIGRKDDKDGKEGGDDAKREKKPKTPPPDSPGRPIQP